MHSLGLVILGIGIGLLIAAVSDSLKSRKRP